MNCGVYKIEHRASGRIYIGSSIAIKKRWKEHRGHLRRGTHHNPHLQSAWVKYGEAAFDFKVLVVCAPEMVLFYEQALIDGLRPTFNACPTAGSRRGYRIPEHVKKTMGAAQRSARKKYEWKGRQLCLSEISEIEGVSLTTLMSRILTMGMSLERAVAKGAARPTNVRLEHGGRALTREEWAKELGMHPRRLTYWLAAGMSIADCIARLNREAKSLSLLQFCELSGLVYPTVKSRLNRGEPAALAFREVAS